MKDGERTMRQRVSLNAEAVDLWTAEKVRDRDELTALIAETVAEFETTDAVIDERSGIIQHRKACLVAAAAAEGKPIDEQGYLRALNAVADEGWRRYATDDVVAGYCAAGSALSGLAAERLRQLGIKRNDPSYADEYVREVEFCGRQFDLPYRGRR